jgi:uncharacterized membrane protein SpoIIM required for sporulation
VIAGLPACLFFLIVGAALVYGAHRGWSWLVDPSVDAWPFYSQSFIKKFFGRDAVLFFTYFVGFAMVALSAAGLLYGCPSN